MPRLIFDDGTEVRFEIDHLTCRQRRSQTWDGKSIALGVWDMQAFIEWTCTNDEANKFIENTHKRVEIYA